jgi:hypothetical protein
VAVFSILIFSLFIYEGYEASGFTALQALIVILLFCAGTVLSLLERMVLPAVRIGILALGVVAFIITGSLLKQLS